MHVENHTCDILDKNTTGYTYAGQVLRATVNRTVALPNKTN